MGIKTGNIASLASRGREVMLYNKAKEMLLKTADVKAAALIENDEFEQAEKLMGNSPYFEALKQWEERYCKRKKFEI